jgi:[ribosomal protein S5]-alanine N-acetyltransferase
MWSEGDLDLETERYTLRPLTRSDAGGLLAHFRDPQVVEFMDIEPLKTLGEAQDVVTWATEIRAEGQGVRWAIRSRDSQRLIGTCGFNSLEYARGRRGELAYDLAVTYWGQGVMSEVLPPVLAFGFETLGLRRIEAMVTVGNARSVRLLERLGFSLEGRLRDHAFWKGRFWDQLVYARLSS